MKPELVKISQINTSQSVVCIVGKNEIPAKLKLNNDEKEYAEKCLQRKDDYIFINSFSRCIYIVRIKDGKEQYKVGEELRKTASNLKKLIKSNNHIELVITSSDAFQGAVEMFTEGLLLSFYSFDKYKTKKKDAVSNSYPAKLLLHGITDDKEYEWLKNQTDAVYFARDIINEPVNHLNTDALVEVIKRAGKEAGFSVDVLNKGKIEALQMGGLLAVNKGSIDPPAFCILEWHPDKSVNTKPVVFVGKGIVYDTGGLNIKTGNYMDGMNGDMAGAAAVTGTFITAAQCALPVYMIGLIPITDNRPGGNAYTQGDIITMHNKMTVEVVNTDAEGRLILADAISYASRYKPELIINIATLTGSAARTYSKLAIAMMTNAGRKYVSLLEECGNEVYERIAELPLWDEYGEMIKSDVADIKNSGGSEAGAITAGKFLEKFTDCQFIHLDIAGTSMFDKDDYYRVKGGTASGLRLMSTFLKHFITNYNKLK